MARKPGSPGRSNRPRSRPARSRQAASLAPRARVGRWNEGAATPRANAEAPAMKPRRVSGVAAWRRGIDLTPSSDHAAPYTTPLGGISPSRPRFAVLGQPALRIMDADFVRQVGTPLPEDEILVACRPGGNRKG